MFVDSDDWVEPYFCKIPLGIPKEQQADLIIFQFWEMQMGVKMRGNTLVPKAC